ncbi:hypothetical protein PFICI_03713 [Pestalotiopsis fici W106-1]|uniref:Peptidase M4 C-terminal domain-containing protein n=1 Tax=Pestalotiopsis fici (strain W106-1 / CGMCC3.15140) TaxID=1229662 RepID=W3XHZ2_PESFW|nr:uncharacterized protein PFICI_03713 [Pestalotiopsis fici W106-1]ETS85688.1 hypothetical protein PFICI_03713 [Pestalotiopsis fici W106-1]
MCSHICSVVPPYLLQSIAEASHNPQHVREAAQNTLLVQKNLLDTRKSRSLSRSNYNLGHGEHQSIVPEQLLEHIANSSAVDDLTRANARRDLQHIRDTIAHYQLSQQDFIDQQTSNQGFLGIGRARQQKATGTFHRNVYDAGNGTKLPGTQVRAEGEQPVDDEAVNEAFDNVGTVLAMYRDKFNWMSIDNHNMVVNSSVHYGNHYQNAGWFPQQQQMVFGDGGELLWNFTKAVDVIGHEITHAVTEKTSPLAYLGQSGALNEHVSDVFGIMAKQLSEGVTAEQADWLIGEECLMPGTKGVALRSMKNPGTAYDDPRLGKDPQPDNFQQYKELDENTDHGGVHIYSGIPNRAFYLVATKFGGNSYEKAGQIWWNTMRSGRIPPLCKFLQFADVTVEVAEELFGSADSQIVRDAWNKVGVVRQI